MRRGGARRKLTWIGATFGPAELASGALIELQIATEATLLERTLGRGTVAIIYGSVVITFPEAAAQFATGAGAWGIRLKEADAPAGALAFSPVFDDDSSEWMTWRSWTLQKTSGVGTGFGGTFANQLREDFIIRNPRKIDADEELVAIFESIASSTGAVGVYFWCRAGILLP